MAFSGGITRLSELVIDFLKTAADGKRIEIDSVTKNEIRFYSGVEQAGWVPAKIFSGWRPYMPIAPVSVFYTAILAPGTTEVTPGASDPLGLAGDPPSGAITVGTKGWNLPDETFISLSADSVLVNGEDISADTGWVVVALQAGVTGNVWYRTKNGVTTVHVAVAKAAGFGTNDLICIIPQGGRPFSYGVGASMNGTINNFPNNFWVNTNGELRFGGSPGAGWNESCFGMATFITES